MLNNKWDLLNPQRIRDLLTEEEMVIIMTDKKLYSAFVRWLTEFSYSIFINQLDLGKKRSKRFHLDHKLSVSEGFENGVNPFWIAHPCNLEILTRKKNLKKKDKCSISESELSLLVFDYGEIF